MSLVYELAVRLWCLCLLPTSVFARIESAYYRRLVRRGWERAQ